MSASGPPSTRSGRPEAIKAVPLRHPWRWITAAVVLVLAGWAVYTVATAPLLNWDTFTAYLFQALIFDGIRLTLVLTVAAMLIGITLGIVLAVMRLSPNPVMSALAWFYIWFFRGTPVLVQIFFWFNLAIILPYLGIGPFKASTNVLITPVMAAIFGLGFNEAAYMAEIVRAGIISVEHGQTEAAQAYVELLFVASFWYLLMTSVLTVGQYYLERYFARGAARELPPTPFQRFRRLLFTYRVALPVTGR